MDIIVNILSLVVIVALVVTLIFVTKAFKAKNDAAEKRKNMLLAGISVVVYLILNALRLLAEGQLG